jgi:predicted MFS family arabinose efflux permease
MSLTEKRLARPVAWSVGALAVAGVAAVGARGSFGLFIKPWEEAFGATRGSVAGISATSFVMYALSQAFAGRLLDRWGGRRVLLVGLSGIAVSYLGAAFATELWQVFLLIGVMAGAASGFAAIFTLNYIAAGIVPSRSGIAFGVLTAAGAGGQVVVLPVATAALGVSLRVSLLAVALALAVAFVVVLRIVHDPGERDRERGTDGGFGTIARTPGFWLLLVPFFICGYTSTGLTDTHLIPYATDHHIAEATASAALATLAAFNVVGVLVAGYLTDRVDRGKLLAATYVARAAALFVLPALTSAGPIFVFAAFFGLADYATVPPTTSLTRSVCRAGGWGFALGLIGASHQVGSALGAWLGGWLFTRTGSYDYSFSSAAVALLVAAALSYLLRERGARPVPDPVPVGI